MTTRTVAIALKIFDNEAYTALSALRRLGLQIKGVERAEIWQMEDGGSESDFTVRVQRSEALFNPNKHVLTVLSDAQPRSGEVWIAPLDATDQRVRVDSVRIGRKYIAWRLFCHPEPVEGRQNNTAPQNVVQEAVNKLLCNPAIERAIVRG